MQTHFTFEAIGTTWKIDILDLLSASQADALLARIKHRIAVFDQHYSRFRDDSLVMEMARRAGNYTLPDDAEKMLQTYHNLYQLTRGAVTPLIGQVLVDAGYDAHYSLVSKPLTTPPRWEETLDFRSPNTLTMKQPAILDFGAIGKGYLIDIVGELLWAEGLRSFTVDAGGDILQRSASGAALRVGLENPHDVTQVIGVAEIANRSICGSAGNRRVWGEFHHIINPHTLKSPRDISAVWAVASTTMLADAMTTASFFVPPETLMGFYPFEFLLLYADGTMKKSPQFPAEIFLAT